MQFLHRHYEILVLFLYMPNLFWMKNQFKTTYFVSIFNKIEITCLRNTHSFIIYSFSSILLSVHVCFHATDYFVFCIVHLFQAAIDYSNSATMKIYLEQLLVINCTNYLINGFVKWFWMCIYKNSCCLQRCPYDSFTSAIEVFRYFETNIYVYVNQLFLLKNIL